MFKKWFGGGSSKKDHKKNSPKQMRMSAGLEDH